MVAYAINASSETIPWLAALESESGTTDCTKRRMDNSQRVVKPDGVGRDTDHPHYTR